MRPGVSPAFLASLLLDFLRAKARALVVVLVIVLGTTLIFNAGQGLLANDNENFFRNGLHSRHLNQPFNWNLPEEIDNGRAEKQEEGSGQEEEDYSDVQNEERIVTCRNSVQGRSLIADDRGYLCLRPDLLFSGCCNVNATRTIRYACDGCVSDSGCCKVYEQCISCCMDPHKKTVLSQILEKAQSSQNLLLLSVTDQFELCLAKCRTSSSSVLHENIYRDPQFKYCYKSETKEPA